ncbi:hypothetical protein GCM10007301_26290 [Azorhizobium oxalatiphilum]|uniref:Acyltransferase 3 domain-containing protein n=1 Tax=Azorhizobium oxalatiphilum TaxID=980631 RepID=A0A917FAP7_9HYPH|nr:acyltransferase [Azorhizobium oxalatiphilum]GGF65260.1 hypothetical protein GCM10007301_26290 [Azorhizobium oxalatiphilum]
MPYEPALDGIRALAITAIAIYHASPALLPGGWAGVDVFFVLSGYLITRLLADEMTATGRIAFGRFYARRALRLLPAFALLLAFMLVRAAMAPSFAHATPILQSTGIAATYLMNWNRAFNWLPQDLLGHTWSLSMEEQFYLLWPVCFLFLRGRRPLAWLCGVVVLVVAWRSYLALTGADAERTYNGFDTHADALAIGCIFALVPLGARLRRLLAVTAPLALLALAALLLLMPHRALATQTLGLTAAALASAWLVVAAREEGWLKRLLSLRPVAYTGRISYGWYLWHYPFLVLGIWADPDISTAHRLALVFAAYPVAMASYHFVERPCLRLRGYFRPIVPAPAILAPAQ